MAVKQVVENFTVAQSAAIILDKATANETLLRGLQGIGFCLGFTMKTLEVPEMGRRISLTVPSGGTYEKTSIPYNFTAGNISFDIFRNASLNSVRLTAIRLFIQTGGDFTAPDLISDPASGLYVGTITDPKADSPGALVKGNLEYMPAGPFSVFVAHTGPDGTVLSYTAATRTFTRSSGSFITDGFEAGDTVIADYCDGNDPLYLKVESVAATSMVMVDGVGNITSLTGDFTGVADTELHGASPTLVSN